MFFVISTIAVCSKKTQKINLLLHLSEIKLKIKISNTIIIHSFNNILRCLKHVHKIHKIYKLKLSNTHIF